MDKGLTSDYGKLSGVLAPMGTKVEGLVRDLIASVDLTILNVSHRVKSDDSATKKIDGASGKYGTYGDLHDMLGVRVVTYLARDVDRVVAVLRDNFDVDEARSLDKMKGLDPDRFGYLSYHLVVKLSDARCAFAEWAPYSDIYFEVQIRSVLQHAWAEIEHDLGYKSTSGIPAQLKRRFARLAGLLETADSEFDAVSGEVVAHVERVSKMVEHGSDVAIDRDSIRALILSEGGVVREADRAIAAAIGATLDPGIGRGYADARADELSEVGFTSTEQVSGALQAEEPGLVEFAVRWFMDSTNDPDDDDEGGARRYKTLPPGVSLFYLYLHKRLEQPQGEVGLTLRNMDDPAMRAALRRTHDTAFGRPRA